MADHAASFNPELREMVRRPKVVWPGLLKHNLKQKHIPGDGNCLFASLSDQLYDTPDKHAEIRARIIEHMRNFRPLFEHYVQTEDVQTRRALRSTTAALRQESDDPYADYLTLMSRLGTYGGEPELVAFCQAYDQDVRVHLPRFQSYGRENLDYTNEYRNHQAPPPILHVCYGGNEETRAHYDSARNRDGSHPRSQNSPRLEPQDFRTPSLPTAVCSSPTHNLTARAIRNSRADLSSELFHELHPSEARHSASCLDALSHRARSSSVSSSHRSSSSKRSLDDDGDNPRSAKRADRRRNRRKRTDLSVVTLLRVIPVSSKATTSIKMDFSNIFRLVNLATGVIMVLGAVGGLELLPQVPPYLPRYASFLFSFLGRGVFYIFVGSLILEGHVLRHIAGALIIFVGIGYVVLEFMPSVEPPSNMRDSDAGWGAEQV
ncbi:hypothetical protein DV737_g603, partial [Chaetothyriales sp. CBS 132003]